VRGAGAGAGDNPADRPGLSGSSGPLQKGGAQTNGRHKKKKRMKPKEIKANNT